MKVVELFDSIEGEGKRSGSLATFVRFAGCNLRCSYCDTAYALFGEKEACEYHEMTVDEIVASIHYMRVTLTGGEPMMQEGIYDLLHVLNTRGYEVNVETNGTVKPMIGRGEFWTMDYKLPSSGMEDRMRLENYENLTERDVVKFVIGSDEDMDRTVEVVERLQTPAQVFLGAVSGKYPERKIVERMLREPVLRNARLQLQIHKHVWSPEVRGV